MIGRAKFNLDKVGSPQGLLRGRGPRGPFLWLALYLAIQGFLGLSAYAQAPALLPPIIKDPKLCSLLRQLRDEVPQTEDVPLSREQPAEGARRFSAEKASKPIADALRARLMRINENGEVQVYIELSAINSETLAALAALGTQVQIIGKPAPDRGKGEVLTRVPTVQALLPVTMIQQVEELPFVHYVRLPSYALSSAANPPSVTTQGDIDLNASAARSTFGVDGTGVKVGVISSGIGGVFASGCTTDCSPIANTATTPSPITLNDLPTATGMRAATTVGSISAGTLVSVTGGITAAKSHRGDGDLEAASEGSAGAEGTALLEIVHDLAPGAALSFANAGSDMEFEQAVDALASTNDVVVDDIFFLGQPSFDGTSAVSENTSDALNNNSNPIRAYITSGGNLALDHYQGVYSDSGTDGLLITGQSGHLHQFAATPPGTTTNVTSDFENFGTKNNGENYYDPVVTLPPNAEITVYLAWNDPVGASTNDYDLFLVPLSCNGNSTQNGLPLPPCSITGLPVGSAVNVQSGTQDPMEDMTFTNTSTSPTTVGIVIQNVNNMAAPRMFDLFVSGYQDKENIPNHNFNTMSGSVPAQSDAGGGVVSVGAINSIRCQVPDNCTGEVESFSSQGPTQMTPQVTTTRTKPDLIAVDEVCIDGAGGFGHTITSSDLAAGYNCPVSPPASDQPTLFEGSSAAAPHVAAIAALALQAAPCLLAEYPSPPSSPPSATSAPEMPTAAQRIAIQEAIENHAELLSAYYQPVQNNFEGYGIVDALATVTAMLATPSTSGTPPTVVTPATQTVSAISNYNSTTNNYSNPSIASVVITGSGKDPNSCPLVAIEWSSATCTSTNKSNQAAGLSTTINCPAGVNTVQIAPSSNSLSFPPLSEFPVTTIIVTDFTLSASAISPVNSTPTSSVYTITVASSPQGSFTNAVSLACTSGLPAGSTCYFSPAAVTPGSSSVSSATSTLTIVTPGTASIGHKAPPVRPNLKPPAVWYAFLLILIVLAIWSRTSHKQLGFRIALGALLALLAVSPLGCGSNGTPSSTSTTPPGPPAIVTITGTSNQVQHTTTVSLTAP